MRENRTYGSMRGQGRGIPLLALLYCNKKIKTYTEITEVSQSYTEVRKFIIDLQIK